MHVITRLRLKEFWTKHPESQSSLRSWFKRVEVAEWKSFNDLNEMFPSADAVEKLTVFNISGNKYRLIALIDYPKRKVFVRAILTHSEYDKEAWKNDPWFK